MADTMNDAKNCGVCGHDCLGGKCLKGACQPIILATAQVHGLRLLTFDNTLRKAAAALGISEKQQPGV